MVSNSVTVEDDWLPSNSFVPSIFGFPLNPTIIAPPVFWNAFINPLQTLKQKASVYINMSVGFFKFFFFEI